MILLYITTASLAHHLISRVRPSVFRTKNKNYNTINVTDFDPLELARQFTPRESKLYLRILPEEVLELGQPGAPSRNLKAISSLSTAITGWVTECILDESDAKKRTALVKFFVKYVVRK